MSYAPADTTRCEGRRPYGGVTCPVRNRCARHLALGQPSDAEWVPVHPWLCTDEARSARIPVVPAQVKEAA